MTNLSATKLKPELIQQLPRFALFPSNSEFKKDFNYYKSTDNNWNNKHRITKRFLPYYHDFNDKAAPKINQMKQLEVEDREQQETWKRAILTTTHKETYARLHTRAAERKHLETASGQSRPEILRPNSPVFESQLSEKVSLKRPLHSKIVSSKRTLTDNKWNYLLETDKKRADLVARPVSVQKEQEFVEMVQKKIKEEDTVNQLREEVFKAKRNEIREKFIRRHNSNIDLETKYQKRPPLTLSNNWTSEFLAKMVPVGPLETERAAITNREKFGISEEINEERALQPNETLMQAQRKQSNALTVSGEAQDLPLAPEMSKTQASFFRSKYSQSFKSCDMTKSHQNIHSEYIEALAKPKQKYKKPKSDLERNDFKGMWVKQLDEKMLESTNEFTRGVTAKSPMFSSMLDSARNSRASLKRTGVSPSSTSRFLSPSEQYLRTGSQSKFSEVMTSQKISPTSTIRFNLSDRIKMPNDDATKALNDLEDFEVKILNITTKLRGYPRIAYQEAIKLSDTAGFKELMKEKGMTSI